MGGGVASLTGDEQLERYEACMRPQRLARTRGREAGEAGEMRRPAERRSSGGGPSDVMVLMNLFLSILEERSGPADGPAMAWRSTRCVDGCSYARGRGPASKPVCGIGGCGRGRMCV